MDFPKTLIVTQHMSFVEVAPAGKTRRFVIYAKRDAAVLGYVSWFSRWRQYAFFPDADRVFNSTCMDEISAFIKTIMADRRAANAQVARH